MTRHRIQNLSAAAVLLLGAVIVWAISGLEGVREVHPRFPAAVQLYGVYLMLISPLIFLPTPIPALGRLGLWNAIGLGLGGLIIGAGRSGALLAIPLVCIAIALSLWPPAPHPDEARLPTIILTTGGMLAAILPAAWAVWGSENLPRLLW